MRILLFILLLAASSAEAQTFARLERDELPLTTSEPMPVDPFETGDLPANSTWMLQYELIFRISNDTSLKTATSGDGPSMWQKFSECPIDTPGGTRYDSTYKVKFVTRQQVVRVQFTMPTGSTAGIQYNNIFVGHYIDTTISYWYPGDWQWQWHTELDANDWDYPWSLPTCVWHYVSGYPTTTHYHTNFTNSGLRNDVYYESYSSSPTYAQQIWFYETHQKDEALLRDTIAVKLRINCKLVIGNTEGRFRFFWAPYNNFTATAKWACLMKGSTLWKRRIS